MGTGPGCLPGDLLHAHYQQSILHALFLEKQKGGLTPVSPATQEAEAEESLEPRNLKADLAKQ
jgi:hypothetical protein